MDETSAVLGLDAGRGGWHTPQGEFAKLTKRAQQEFPGNEIRADALAESAGPGGSRLSPIGQLHRRMRAQRD
eukprot:53740-Eustigmatos_ZCMA.PRE.1